MYKLYEKVPKTDENEYGIKIMEEDKNPFKEGPCLLSMIAVAIWEKDINGALNQAMEALRLRTNHNENTGIGIEDFEGKILSLAYSEPLERITAKGRKFNWGYTRTENLDDEFTRKYLFPLIEEEGKKIDILQAMKNMRNVNIMTYCGATQSALRMEECLVNRMKELGYSEEEISKIQSQMCIIGYATDAKMRAEFVEHKKIKSTCLSFGDVNDGDVCAPQGIKESAKKNNTIYYDEGYYFHYGNGEHGAKNYISINDSLSLGISSVLTRAISNSIENCRSSEFKPLTQELLTQDIEKIIEGIRQGKKREELIPLVDNDINYSKPLQFTEEKIQMLNEFIQKNLNNRRNSTDYGLLHKISEMVARDLKVTNRNFGEITKPLTEEQTKKVALEFFKSLDRDLYERAKNIIEGNSDIDFNMYKLDKDDDFSIQKDNGMPVHTKKPCVISKNGKSAVYLPCKGTIEDIYLLVHELSHTFDLIPNDNPTRNLLGEVTPYCLEAMLSQYLVENGIATREDVTNREKGDIVSHYDDGVETFTKLELMKVREQKGEIKQEDIRTMQKKYGLTNRQIEYVLGRLLQSEPNVDYRARYMIAQIVYPHYMEQYKGNLRIAIKTLKEYFEMIKDNNLAGALEKLGIQPTLDSVPGLIETSNRRINSLEQPELFSEQEIGKGTINVPTEEKDKANSQIYAKEIERKLQK